MGPAVRGATARQGRQGHWRGSCPRKSNEGTLHLKPYQVCITESECCWISAHKLIRLGPAQMMPPRRDHINVTYPHGKAPIATYVFQYRTRSKSESNTNSTNKFTNNGQGTFNLKASSSVHLLLFRLRNAIRMSLRLRNFVSSSVVHARKKLRQSTSRRKSSVRSALVGVQLHRATMTKTRAMSPSCLRPTNAGVRERAWKTQR